MEERLLPTWVVHRAVATALGLEAEDVLGIEGRSSGYEYAVLVETEPPEGLETIAQRDDDELVAELERRGYDVVAPEDTDDPPGPTATYPPGDDVDRPDAEDYPDTDGGADDV